MQLSCSNCLQRARPCPIGPSMAQEANQSCKTNFAKIARPMACPLPVHAVFSSSVLLLHNKMEIVMVPQ